MKRKKAQIILDSQESLYKEAITKMSSNDNKTGNGENYYNKLIDSAQQKIDGLQAQIEKWEQEQQRLNADLKEYNLIINF